MKHNKKGRFMTTTSTQRGKNNSRARRIFISYNFQDLSSIEEIKDRSFFFKIGKDAATNAVNENKALHIPITFLQDGWIVRRMPNGSIERIQQIKTGEETYKRRKLTKGTIISVK